MLNLDQNEIDQIQHMVSNTEYQSSSTEQPLTWYVYKGKTCSTCPAV